MVSYAFVLVSFLFVFQKKKQKKTTYPLFSFFVKKTSLPVNVIVGVANDEQSEQGHVGVDVKN